MLEPIPFAGFVEIDDPIVCCNHNCNQGRDCPLRKKELTDEEIVELTPWNKFPYESFVEYTIDDVVDFARAILRKAQKK